ncbi:hypothetical protein BUALT_Bualt11G0008600 [Buddleja alternifolia]|uniref:Sialate O-acetylesterase domain-containing protein n=1 Tax=Buddleja alternifolia TaxID=168488 RepID=A0AAV6X2D4_9LAMI|nr:hypothetical protein BUALT_Bualt11G0008600 [Buddleja alternifolia]
MGGGMFFLVCLMLLAHSSILVRPKKLNDNSLEGKNIFILAGQSNMAGRGSLVPMPSECQRNPRILRLNAKLTWEEAQEPLHQDIDIHKTCGIGPGMAFANSILERDSARVGVIGLVPCAVGATNITAWQRGGFLFNQLVERAQAALRDGGRIRGILWYQGESNTDNLENVKGYKGKLETFFKDIRSDLKLPQLPIIQVALASGQNATYTEMVRKAQLEIKLPNVTCIDAKGLQIQSDKLHLTTEAEVRLGKMLAGAALKIMEHI